MWNCKFRIAENSHDRGGCTTYFYNRSFVAMSEAVVACRGRELASVQRSAVSWQPHSRSHTRESRRVANCAATPLRQPWHPNAQRPHSLRSLNIMTVGRCSHYHHIPLPLFMLGSILHVDLTPLSFCKRNVILHDTGAENPIIRINNFGKRCV